MRSALVQSDFSCDTLPDDYLLSPVLNEREPFPPVVSALSFNAIPVPTLQMASKFYVGDFAHAGVIQARGKISSQKKTATSFSDL
jgi:hypothetical protein